jgi:hypothetical protein
MIAIGCQRNSNRRNNNYDEIKKREFVQKVKHEIFGMLPNKTVPHKKLKKSISCENVINSSSNRNRTQLNFSNDVRNEITKMLTGKLPCNIKPKESIHNVDTTKKNQYGKTYKYNNDNFNMKNDFESIGAKCDNFQTKLKLFSL